MSFYTLLSKKFRSSIQENFEKDFHLENQASSVIFVKNALNRNSTLFNTWKINNMNSSEQKNYSLANFPQSLFFSKKKLLVGVLSITKSLVKKLIVAMETLANHYYFEILNYCNMKEMCKNIVSIYIVKSILMNKILDLIKHIRNL